MKRSAWRYLWKSEDIRKKLLITLMLLIIYRLAANVPVPGIDPVVLKDLGAVGGAAGNLFNLLDLLSGGTVSHFSVLAMGVYPYITAQIILQLLVPIIPALERKLKEDPKGGQLWMERWTVILTVPMAILSAIGQINIFTQLAGGRSILVNFGFVGVALLPTLATLSAMVAGTMFGIWLGQLISEYGIPNQGLSLIIFAGIVARIPNNLSGIFADQQNWWWLLIIILIILVLTIFAIVFVQQGRRNVRVIYKGRRMGNRMSMPVQSNLPLMVNMAGMIPLIFAQSLLTFPAIVASYFIVPLNNTIVSQIATAISHLFGGNSPWYALIYFTFVVAFTFFYTDVLFQQQNYGENLRKQGAEIQNVKPGPATQRYLTRVQRRITLPGAVFLGLIAVLPYILSAFLPQSTSAGLFLISSAGLLIVVGVVRDTFSIIDAELKLHGYEERLVKG